MQTHLLAGVSLADLDRTVSVAPGLEAVAGGGKAAPAAPGTVSEAGGGGPGVSGWLRTDITHKIELACFRTWKSGGHCTGHCLRLMYLLASHASFLMLIWT